MRPTRTAAAAVTAVIAVVCALGCGSDSGEPQAARGEKRDAGVVDAVATVEEPQAAARMPRGPLVKLRQSPFGTVLFSGGDRAIYLFTRDGKNRTRCYGDCAEAWPPFFAKGKPRAGRGVDRSLLGTIRRRDGRRQVTYRGQPLYFYVSDPPRQVLCQNVVEFGGTWLVVDAAGNAVR